MRWNYIHIDTSEVMMMTGWKLYIYGNTIEDSKKLSQLVLPVSRQYNVTTKVATEAIIKRNAGKKLSWSVCVIYLNECSVESLIDDLYACLETYHKSGLIYGSKRINDKIHCRYDLSIPLDHPVPYEQYLPLYRGEYGLYNIPNNKDLLWT